MAHELMINDDGAAAMFYVKDPPWHNLGIALGKPPTAAEAIRAARLDWEVAKAPLFYHESIENTAIVPNLVALTPGAGWPNRERPLFGVATHKYEVLQNRDAFAFFDPLVRSGYATYETAGALGKGERVWVLARLRGNIDIGAGDTIQRHLLLSNRHDGHGAVEVKFTPIRVVCQNTLSMALLDERETFAVRHQGDLGGNLKSIADAMMDEIEEKYRKIRAGFLLMREVDLENDDLTSYLEIVFPDPGPEDAEASPFWERRQNIARWSRSGSAWLFSKGKHRRLAGPTLWGAYNAVTEFVDHCIPPKSRGRQPRAELNRIWFGGGHQVKARAYDAALELCKQLKN